MATSNRIAEVASAVGEPARAAMLAALMDGRALTAAELAGIAAITPQTASGHLARLVSVGLIAAEKQGRHRYHRLASPEVARMIESVMQIAGGVTLARPPCRIGPKDAALRQARTCYDHLAGGLGVSIADALRASGAVEIAGDAAALTESGRVRMQLLGILAPDGNPRSARPVCRPCLDWSERPPTSPGLWGPPSAPMRWIRAGCGGAPGHGRWRSRRQGRSDSGGPSGSTVWLANLGGRGASGVAISGVSLQ